MVLSRKIFRRRIENPLDDFMQLSGSNSIFVANELTDALEQRIRDKDISPASPLPGIGKHKVMDQALELIDKIYADWQPWLQGLVRLGVEEAWRANILHVEQFHYVIDHDLVELSFILPPGSYATALLRELCCYQNS